MFQKNNPSLLLIKEGWFLGGEKPPILFLNVTSIDWHYFGDEILRTIFEDKVRLSHRIKESPDVVLLEREPNKKEIGVDVTRDFIRELSITPSDGHYRIGIIPFANELNVESQNALLKTLEEPQKNRFLVLFSPSAKNILETLRSRCFKVGLNFSEEKGVLDFLLEKYPDFSKEQMNKIILWSEAKMAQSREIAQNFDLWREVATFYENPGKFSSLDRLYLIKKWLKNKDFGIDDFFKFFIFEARLELKSSIKAKKNQETKELLKKIKKAHESLVGSKKTSGANPELILESFMLSV